MFKKAPPVLVIVAALWTLGAGERPSGVDERGAIVADTTLRFTVEVGSRLYPEWKEPHQVRLREPFFLGDQPFTAAVEAFIPDFKIVDGRIINASPTLANPAAFVVVYGDSGAVDSSWAFQNFPPHFSPASFFSFKLLAVEGFPSPPAKEEGK